MASKVKPIPEGMHSVIPHLIVKGAAEAIDFYKKAFGAKEVMRMPGPDGKGIMHAEIKIGDSMIFMAEEYPDMGCRSPKALGGSPVTIHLYVENVDSVYNQAVAAGAKATMPLMNMFWGDRYGKVTDPFGHEWSLAQHVEDVPPQELGPRAAAAMKQMCKS